MTMLRLTDAGRTAMADGGNRELENVQLIALAIGDGVGPGGAADDVRTQLRSQRHREAVTGTSMTSGRLAVRATYEPTATYAVTEAGIIARVGDTGAEFLLAYWAVAAAADAVATTVSGTTLVVAGVIDVTHAAAEVAVTVSADITFGGAGSLAGLEDTPDAIAPHLYARGNAGGTAIEWGDAPLSYPTEGDLPAPALALNSAAVVRDYAETGEPTLALRTAAADRWAYLPTRLWVALQLASRATTVWVQNQLSALLPTGTLLEFAGTIVPAGYLACDGSDVSRTQYAALYAVIGTRYGPGDGATTFALPDFRRRVSVGTGGALTAALGSAVGDVGGRETHQLTIDEMPEHAHTPELVADAAGSHRHGSGTYETDLQGAHSHSYRRRPLEPDAHFARGPDIRERMEEDAVTGVAGAHTHDVRGYCSTTGTHTHAVTGSVSSAGGGAHHSILQPSLVVLKIIRI